MCSFSLDTAHHIKDHIACFSCIHLKNTVLVSWLIRGWSRDYTPQYRNKDNSLSFILKVNSQENTCKMHIRSFNNKIIKLKEILLLPLKLVTNPVKNWKQRRQRTELKGNCQRKSYRKRWIKFKCMLFIIKHFRNKIVFVCQPKQQENLK